MKSSYKRSPLTYLGAILILLLVTVTWIPAGSVGAAGVAIPKNLKFEIVVSGLSNPLFVTHAGDGSNRLFIVERTGRILIYKNGAVNSAPFLNLASSINFTGGEQGLLGLAFAPDYAASGKFYVVYIKKSTNTIALARFQVSAANPDLADAGSKHELLTISKNFANHNGGMLAFGPDGYLYMGVGDGGSGGDPDGNGQDRNTLLGKILRLDVSSTEYTVPPTNPFAGQASMRGEIWAYGLRNPWRFSFDRSTNDLYIGDVGQNLQEEVDFQSSGGVGGQNYGWNLLEGNLCYLNSPCPPPVQYVPPVAVYDHGPSDSIGCSVTSGYVYRGSNFPALVGVYLFADFCTGRLWGLVKDGSASWTFEEIQDTGFSISSFGQDQQGELYLTDYGSGSVLHIVEAPTVLAKFRSKGPQDGGIVETSENSSVGGPVNSSATFIRLGDLQNRRQLLGILSFQTAGLPDNAVITSATLMVKKLSSVGSDPFAVLAPLQADIRRGFFNSSSTLAPADFQATPSRRRIVGNVIAQPGNFYLLGLSRGIAYINKGGTTQFRLSFALDDNNNAVSDFVRIASGDSPVPGDRPMLKVRYYVP